jgi:hypothetical protein
MSGLVNDALEDLSHGIVVEWPIIGPACPKQHLTFASRIAKLH